ncbi:MAG TPA: class I SAM-dependent methyltransferase [Desulfuromonadales bacterium]|nr:class I SAM-dependent methyltransferase [Desulfuromonadales bacterium]
MFQFLRLAMNRGRSDGDYRAMQEQIARSTVAELKSRGIDFADKDVVELAAGLGGYSRVYAERAKTFIATDQRANPFFAEQGIAFVRFDVTKPFPLATDSVDLICTSSLIEHIEAPKSCLAECRRILRPGGTLYLSFPPFYSLLMVGGHGFKPFHFLGEKLCLKLHNAWRGVAVESYATAWGDYGLYPLTVAGVARLIRESGFDLYEQYTRMSPVNTARLPGFLADLATWHVCYLARPRAD